MLSIPHLIIIFVVALAVLGPDKLPQMARTMGKMMADFRRVTGDFRYQIESEIREAERQTRLKEEGQLNAQAEKTAWEASGNVDTSDATPDATEHSIAPPGTVPAGAGPSHVAAEDSPCEPTLSTSDSEHGAQPTEQPNEVAAGSPQKPADAHRSS